MTNNVAEYHGLLAGLRAARDAKLHTVVVRGDSKLVIDQMTGASRDASLTFES